MSQVLKAVSFDHKITHSDLLDNYKGREGKFIKGFLINDKRNKNGWRVDWNSILLYASDFINHPGIYFENFGTPDHTDGASYKENMANQELHRVVNIVDVMTDESTHTLNYVGEIIDEEFEKLWDAGKINMTSPAIFPIEMEKVGEMPDGRPELDVFKWRALHNAYIEDPAFEDAAATLGTCDGDGVACKVRLSAKSMSLIGNDNLAPLMEVPLIRKVLNSRNTPCEIKAQVEAMIASENIDDCVTTKVKIIRLDNPDMPADEVLATANAFCKSSMIAEIIKSQKDY